MPSVKFESNGGSSYDHECSYCDAVSFNDARFHELAPILIIALQLEYYIDQDQLGGPKFSQCAVNWRTRVINSGAISRLAMLCTVSPGPRSAAGCTRWTSD
jgi:hypothetical protein